MNCPRRSVGKHAHVCFLFTPSVVMYVLRPCEIDTDYGKGRRLYYLIFGEWLRILCSIVPPGYSLAGETLPDYWLDTQVNRHILRILLSIYIVYSSDSMSSLFLSAASVCERIYSINCLKRSFLAHQIGISVVLPMWDISISHPRTCPRER